jgi:YD repeat-containing protein
VATIRFGDGNWLTNFFNTENRLSGLRLPSGTLLTNFFDFAGRLTNRQAKISGVVTETASFEYNGHDAVTRMTDDTGSTTNLFDAAERLWGIDYPSGASVRYQLDLLDRISAVTNKASAGGTAYVTRYQRDAVGNVTNVIDPFNGNTSFEFDRVGRRTKRTLPNGIVSEWQYNWRDQITNITHKTSGGTTLASVLYERATGGEPTKLTREDGTYVELKYDASFRLTNEVYYSSGGVPQTTNNYGYDASGSRVRLVKGSTTLTNRVSAGYRITAVKDAANGNTIESYAYDNGGRVSGITRDGATLNLGYNSAE